MYPMMPPGYHDPHAGSSGPAPQIVFCVFEAGGYVSQGGGRSLQASTLTTLP